MRIEEWLNVEFVKSSAFTTDQFKCFAEDVKAELTDQLKDTGIVIEKLNMCDFSVAGLLRMDWFPKNKYMYFGLPSVRTRENEWFKNITLRRTDSVVTFLGEQNTYTGMTNFKDAVTKLFEEVIRDEE